MKQILYVVLVFMSMACTNSKQKGAIISNNFKLQFLETVLSDTLHIGIINTKQQLISEPFAMPPLLPQLNSNGNWEHKSVAKYIANALHTNDTLWVKEQMENNKSLHYRVLTEKQFKVADISKFTTNYDTLFTVVQISKPIFNKKRNVAYLRISYGTSGTALLLQYQHNKWTIKEVIEDWVE